MTLNICSLNGNEYQSYMYELSDYELGIAQTLLTLTSCFNSFELDSYYHLWYSFATHSHFACVSSLKVNSLEWQ